MTEPRTLGVVRTKDEIINALNAWRAELGISLETLDKIAGLPDGYSAKLLNFPPTKNVIAPSFDYLHGGLCVEYVMRVDEKALAKLLQRMTQRDLKGAHAKPLSIKNQRASLSDIMGRLGKRGAKARKRKLYPEERQTIAKRGAKSRWAGVRRSRKKAAARKRARRKFLREQRLLLAQATASALPATPLLLPASQDAPSRSNTG